MWNKFKENDNLSNDYKGWTKKAPNGWWERYFWKLSKKPFLSKKTCLMRLTKDGRLKEV